MEKIFEISFIIFLVLALLFSFDRAYQHMYNYYEQQSKKWKDEDEPELMEVSRDDER